MGDPRPPPPLGREWRCSSRLPSLRAKYHPFLPLTSGPLSSASRKSPLPPSPALLRGYLSSPRQGLGRGCLSLVPEESPRCPSTEGPAPRAGSPAKTARAVHAWPCARQAQGWGSSHLQGSLRASRSRRDAKPFLRRPSRRGLFWILRRGAAPAGR